MDGPPDKDRLMQEFCAFTGGTPAEAEALLSSHEWDVEASVATYFASNDGEDDQAGSDGEMELEDAPAPAEAPTDRLVMGGGRTLGGGPSQPSASSSSQPPPATTRRTQPTSRGPRTLKDLQGDSGGHGGHGHSHDDDDDDDEDVPRDLFAGGEKSGLAVQDPAEPRNPRDQINSIIDRARRGTARPGGDDEPQAPSRFSGRGVTLGGDDAPSQVIEDPSAASPNAAPNRPPRVRRVLRLWREGFSVDDGQLFRYDDPANASTLSMINQGRAPLDLLNVLPGQEVDLELDNQKDQPFVQPKKKYMPFSGSGQRLGSPTPGVETSSSSVAPPATSAAIPSSSTGTNTPLVDVDSSQPTIALQIRLGDGTRLQSRFNTTHTIGDVYNFVNSASPARTQRPYVLMTTFPSKDLDDKSLVLGDMSEYKRGGVVVQKWK